MDKLNQLITDLFRIDQNESIADLSMDDLDTWDSLSHMELIAGIEELFEIELTSDEIITMKSLHAVRSVVENRIDSRQHGH